MAFAPLFQAGVALGAPRTDALTGEITAAGGTAAFQRLDVTDAADVRAFVSAARERYGRFAVLVDNAGVMPLSPLEALKVDEWDRMIDVNVRGALHGIVAALPASAVAEAIAYAMSQPSQVDVNEIVVRPAASAQ
ncbi:SDR family NAD(P)-dependent oxidoreductase [Streptomyces sp. NPDC001634]|uniref:SDR family oxidoreductase n=1 Tax=Streptomyces sp. NPDC001634 TaxID=3154390 RepID=UPI00332A1F30